MLRIGRVRVSSISKMCVNVSIGCVMCHTVRTFTGRQVGGGSRGCQR